MIRVYDGHAGTWRELLLTGTVRVSFMDHTIDASSRQLLDRPLYDAAHPGIVSEPVYRAEWRVNDHAVHFGECRPLRSMAERDLLTIPKPSEHVCSQCYARQVYEAYTLTCRPGLVCAACGVSERPPRTIGRGPS